MQRDGGLERKIVEQVKRNQDAMLDGILKIVSIDSTQSEAQENMPFGSGVDKALTETLALAKAMGFVVENVDHYAGIMKYGTKPGWETDPRYIGIFGHLDVVEAKGEWTNPPFSPAIRDGRIYARGILDNKGPILSCLYALYAIKQLGIELAHPIWIVFGTNEETGMADMDHYLNVKNPPIAGWTPDCKYPVVYAERGRAVFETEADVSHFTPEQFDLDLYDPEFGKLEFRLDEEHKLKVSYPASVTVEEIARKVTAKIDAALMDNMMPVFFPKDGTLCRVLQETYEQVTGLDGTPVTTTGGTYAKKVPNIVPFGPSFPGQKGIAHLPDEWMDIDDLMANAKIYALSLYRLGIEEQL